MAPQCGIDAVANAAVKERRGEEETGRLRSETTKFREAENGPAMRDRRHGECGGLEFKRRNGRVVECGGLENRCSVSTGPGVRIPLSPLNENAICSKILK